jgi:23S rRNA maturation mini-RNase III
MIRPTTEERELAWLGDAVLSLFARGYILREGRGMNPKQLAAMTSNQFLSCFGNPTHVEAQIGSVYQAQGLDAAFAKIEADFLPLFLKQWQKQVKQH